MAESAVPVLEINSCEKKTAYNEIEKYFKSKYGSAPCFFARVPGRVNLIGEHIDYCGFSVLPMAIEQDIILAVGLNDSEVIKLANVDSDKYEDFSCLVNDIQIDISHPCWHHYFLCGYKGIIERHDLKHKGFNVVVKGTIPPSSGLSSSSAFVCASALAVLFANRIFLSKMEMANLCAHSECYIGTEGGGMDQAIGFLAEPGIAKLIDFNPLKASDVPLPSSVAFVVANSCVEMNKAATSHYNIRVVECRLAAKVLAKVHGFMWNDVQKLSEILTLLQKDLKEMSAIVDSSLPKEKYSAEEICSILEISDSEFASLLNQNTLHLQEFHMNQRAKHVFEEALRVKQFKSICESGSDTAIQELGALMNKSHESCRDLYECSHPDLDSLVSIALEAGAIGSRLTGAGWGGCCVSLVMENKIHEFMSTVRKNYYEKKLKLYSNSAIKSAMFLTRPSGGGVVYSNESSEANGC